MVNLDHAFFFFEECYSDSTTQSVKSTKILLKASFKMLSTMVAPQNV